MENELKTGRLQRKLDWLRRHQPAGQDVLPLQRLQTRIGRYRARLLKDINKAPQRRAQLQNVSRLLARDPGSLQALGKVLARGTVRQDLLARVLANRHLQPVLEDFLHRLAYADRIPGISNALYRMGQAGDEAGMRGAKFEVDVGPWLPRVAAVSTQMNGHECDAVLSPGANGRRSVVAMHVMNGSAARTPQFSRKFKRVVSGELKELASRTQQPDPKTGKPLDAVMVIGHPHGADIPRMNWQRAADALRTNLSVILVDGKTNLQRTVFEGGPR